MQMVSRALICATFHIWLTSCAPRVALPINAQIPPIARVDKPYKFEFSESTFSPVTGPTIYSIKNEPKWLSLNSESRTFEGIPSEADVGPLVVDLIAQDGSPGSTSVRINLVVSENSGPILKKSAKELLQSHSGFLSPDTLLLHSSSPFFVSFGRDIFGGTNQSTRYYATCANNTPLPPWINFDSSKLTFYGTAPRSISDFQLHHNFGIRLIASDIPGYAAAVTSFHLRITEHELTFGNNTLAINVVPGKEVSYAGLNVLMYDGAPPSSRDINLFSDDMPSWLKINPATFLITGLAPKEIQNMSFTVTAQDHRGNTANATLSVNSISDANLIINPIGPLKAFISEYFVYKIDQTNIAAKDAKTSFDLGNCTHWLAFDSDSLELYGRVPNDWAPHQERLKMTMALGHRLQEMVVVLEVLDISRPNSSSQGPPFTSPMPPERSLSTSNTTLEQNMSNDRGESKIVVAVVVPMVFVAAFALVAFTMRNKAKQSGAQSLWEKLLHSFRASIRKWDRDDTYLHKHILVHQRRSSGGPLSVNCSRVENSNIAERFVSSQVAQSPPSCQSATISQRSSLVRSFNNAMEAAHSWWHEPETQSTGQPSSNIALPTLYKAAPKPPQACPKRQNSHCTGDKAHCGITGASKEAINQRYFDKSVLNPALYLCRQCIANLKHQKLKLSIVKQDSRVSPLNYSQSTSKSFIEKLNQPSTSKSMNSKGLDPISSNNSSPLSPPLRQPPKLNMTKHRIEPTIHLVEPEKSSSQTREVSRETHMSRILRERDSSGFSRARPDKRRRSSLYESISRANSSLLTAELPATRSRETLSPEAPAPKSTNAQEAILTRPPTVLDSGDNASERSSYLPAAKLNRQSSVSSRYSSSNNLWSDLPSPRLPYARGRPFPSLRQYLASVNSIDEAAMEDSIQTLGSDKFDITGDRSDVANYKRHVVENLLESNRYNSDTEDTSKVLLKEVETSRPTSVIQETRDEESGKRNSGSEKAFI